MTGRALGLPFLANLSAIRSSNARRVTWHQHQGFELLFLLQGATAYEFRDGRTAALAGGQFLVVPAGTSHRGVNAVRGPSTLCGILCAPGDPRRWRGGPFAPAELARIHGVLSAHAGAVCSFGGRLHAALGLLMAELADAVPAKHDPLRLPLLRVQVCAVLIEATRLLQRPAKNRPEQLIGAATQWLERNASEPVRMSALVRHIGLSRSRLFALFKEHTGLGPNDYLQRHRVETARRLLATSSRSITDIALSVGFSSSQYFCAVFRRYLGTSARSFRRGHARRTA